MNLDFTLTKPQANEVLTAIKHIPLNPHEFELSQIQKEDTKNLISVITHKPTQYKFVFDTDNNRFTGFRTPGQGHKIEYCGCRDWYELLRYYRQWLMILKHEIETPDLWELLQQEVIQLKITTEANTPFTLKEQEAIITQISIIKTHIETNYSPTQQQLNTINHKLDLLLDETKKQGREAWIHTAIGITASVILTLALPPEQAQLLWQYITSKFSEAVSIIRLALHK